MYCLLCKEKIPRLRSWRTKSEFCSDEHAAQYKKQTLDRLLTEEADENGGSVPLPLDAPSFDDMAAVADIVGAENEGADAEMDIFGDMGDEAGDEGAAAAPAFPAPAPTADPAFPARSDFDLTGYDGPPVDQVETQSAEDALAALRAIADKGAGPSPETAGAEEAALPGASEAFDSLDALMDDSPAPAGDPGSLEDFLRTRAEQEAAAEAAPEQSDEDTELELAALSPPEPSFDDELALLAELDMAETSTEEPAAVSAEDAADGILDKMVAESDWNTEFQATVDSDFDVEIAQQMEEAAETAPEEQPVARAEAPDAPTDDDFAEAVQAAVEPPAEDAAPSDDDFVESMMAAVEKVSEGAGEAPAAVVAFPDKNGSNKNGSAAGELTKEAIDESLDKDPVQVEATTDSPEGSNGAAPKKRKRKSGRKAPKLKPAMVLAGLHPTAAPASDAGQSEAWKRLAGRTPADDQLTPLIANLTGAAPLLNGNGLTPMRPARTSGELGEARNVVPAAIVAVATEAAESAPSVAAELSAPAAMALRTHTEPLSADFDFPAPSYDGAYAFLAADLAPVAAAAEEKLEIGGSSEPSEPAGLYFDAAAELPEAASEDDGDWFADIEGFESL